MADKENKKRKLRAVMCAKFDEESTVNVIIHYSKRDFIEAVENYNHIPIWGKTAEQRERIPDLYISGQEISETNQAKSYGKTLLDAETISKSLKKAFSERLHQETKDRPVIEIPEQYIQLFLKK